MSEQLKQLKAVFHEIFQIDQAELDFGIYRIMRQKRAEIDEYFEGQFWKDLQLTAKREYEESAESIQKQINQAKKTAFELGYNPDDAPLVKKLQKSLQDRTLEESLEDGVLSDLVQFLGRYYKDGDFLSLPRYRKNSYAVEYNGEEVKLHWANADQYYVKTAERFRDYRFLVTDGKTVHFKITAANTEIGNNKTESGKERRFQLLEKDFMKEDGGELLIFFRYAADEQKRKQAEINLETVKRILSEPPAHTGGLKSDFIEWRKVLSESKSTDKNPNRTLLEKRLNNYTARNTFDYFIHKDLNGFLRRELDFYIKNEIVMLDDIENEDAPHVELYLAKVKALRRIGHKLIAFLAQVENFCKKLFLKKKFVIRTDYCATLDRVPRPLWTDILANDAQINEWRELYAIDEIEADLLNGLSEPPALAGGLSVHFLEANQNLVVDTRHFPEDWKLKLLESFADLDAATDGLLIKADNFHALNLLQEKYHEAVKCIYIDPPYNTGLSEIAYKNGYKHSSWLSIMENRLMLSKALSTSDGVLTIAIDENEQERLGFLLDILYPDFQKTCVTVIHNPGGIQGTNFSYNHEYAYFVYPNFGEYIGLENRNAENADIRPLRDVSTGDHLREDAANCFYPIYVKDKKIIGFGDVCEDSFHPESVNVLRSDGILEVYPIDAQGNERKWVFARQTVESIFDELAIELNSKRKIYDVIRTKRRFNYKTVWTDKKYNANSYGAKLLGHILPNNEFSFPKSIYTVQDSIDAVTQNNLDAVILDYFGGSATTAHAVINLNREDGGRRKYILVETNEYFDSVMLPRIKKVIYSKDWKDGKPLRRDGKPHLLKYFALESYEDAMNNLALDKSDELQQASLKFTDEFREDYLLNYLLEFETRGSPSLLNFDNFAAPFAYEMKIAADGVGETCETPIDLVETFNYLIGLNVENVRQIDGVRVVRGKTRTGERCLILWRTTKDIKQDLADKRLNDFLEKQNFDFSEIDALYINGDAAIPIGNVRRETDTWQIKMIEAEFLKRMFEGG